MEYAIRFLAGGLIVSLFAVDRETSSAPKALRACSEPRRQSARLAIPRVLEARHRLRGDRGAGR